jgi:MarR family transcriptional regulator, organic hydroperoxide resistance regulator
MKTEKILNFDTPDENLGYLLWQVSVRWQAAMNSGLGDLGLTQTHFVVMAALHWLSLNQPSVTQNDIGVHAGIDKMTISKTLKSLQAKGFVRRQEHAVDTRAKEVGLTETGIDMFTKANTIVEDIDNQYFSEIKDNKKALKLMLKNLIEGN